MKKFIIASVLLTGPMVAMAATFTDTINNVAEWVALLIPLLLSLAVVAFFWGLVKYIANADDEGAKESGKTLMIWGMIAIFVMVGFWGIIGYVQESIGIEGTIKTGTPVSATDLMPK